MVIGVVELVVRVVSFGQIDAVGPIFASVPLMVILVIAIIVAGVVPGTDDDFLRGSGFASQRDYKCRGGEKQSETLNGSLQFSVDRELRRRVVACCEYGCRRRLCLCDCGHVRCL
jgi:hypothetical protein